MRALRRGQRGPDVERWQRFLIEHGWMREPAHGIFEDTTDAGTRLFQQREQLNADGMVGARTIICAQSLGFEAYRPLRPEEVSATLGIHAKRILQEHAQAPFGSEFPFRVDGRRYFGRLEEHFNQPGGPLRPWGHHAQVTLFVEVTVGPGEPVYDDSA